MDSIHTENSSSAEGTQSKDCYEISDAAQLHVAPTVSVLMTAYNHGPYLAEAIASVLGQETDFNIELIIGDDSSPDNTLAIAKYYQQNNPKVIRIITANLNVGAAGNFDRILQTSRGRFIAICEGDDFWLSRHKLQKQVEALEKREEIGVCFHKSATCVNGQIRDCTQSYDSRVYTLQEHILADFHFVQTNTLLIRRQILDQNFLTFLRENGSVGDFFMRFYGGINGALCIAEQMGCYRVLSRGSWTSSLDDPARLKQYFLNYLKDLDVFDKMLRHAHTAVILKYKIMIFDAIAASNIGVQDKLKMLFGNMDGIGLRSRIRLVVKTVLKSERIRYIANWLKARLPIRFLCSVQSLRARGAIKVGHRSYIHPSVHILGKECVQIGNNTCVSEGGWLNVNHRHDSQCAIRVGDNCFIGKQNFFTSGKIIEVGDFTLTALGCRFVGSSHNIRNPEIPYLLTSTTDFEEIKIGVNCFLGAGVTVLGNVKVGHGSVIGANSLVLNDIPPFSLAHGTPATVVKRYSFKRGRWITAAELSAEDEASMPSEQLYLSNLRSNFPVVNMPWIAAGKSMGDL